MDDIYAYQQLLLEKGYNEASLKNNFLPGTLAARLYTAFEQCKNMPGEDTAVRTFQVETTGFAPEDNMRVDFRFRFEYDPVREALYLKAMVADAGNVKVLVVGKDPSSINESIPEAAFMFASLAEYTAIREQKAAQRRKAGPRKGKGI